MTLPAAALAVLAGLLLAVAFPPAGWWGLAPASVALLTWLCRGSRPGPAALLGLLTGLAFFLPLLHWSGSVAGPAAWLALALAQAAFFAGLGTALALLGRLPGWPAWCAAAWVLQEAVRSRVPFGGFPWGRLGFVAGHTPLTPLAAVGGVPLVSLAIAFAGTALARLTGSRPIRPQLGWLAAVVAVLAAAAAVPLPAAGQTVEVAAVQGNVPRLGLGFNAQRAAVLGDHVAATQLLAQRVRSGALPAPQLVIWPENSADIDPLADPLAGAAITSAAQAVGVPVLVGAVLDGPGDHVRNAGIVWDPRSGPGQMYVKRHPVPFGEYIPLRGLVRHVSGRVALVPHDFLAGHRVGLLTVGGVRLADVICFEVAYDGLVRSGVRAGGQLLVVQTNNATFGRSGESPQQLAMGRVRAVETGRAVVVAATSGISALIDPTGRVVRRAGFFVPALLTARLPLRSALTPAMRAGAWPELAVCLAALAGLAMAGWRR